MDAKTRELIRSGNWLNERKELDMGEIIGRIEMQFDVFVRNEKSDLADYAATVLHYLYNRVGGGNDE